MPRLAEGRMGLTSRPPWPLMEGPSRGLWVLGRGVMVWTGLLLLWMVRVRGLLRRPTVLALGMPGRTTGRPS